MSSVRTPRFGRSAEPQSIRITSRDLYIISRILRYRLLDSKQIAALVGGSLQNLLRRLKQLYNNSYIDRPIAQLDYYRAGGSKPLVYALGNRGADLLQEKLGIPRREIDWTAKNRSVKRIFLLHAHAVSEILVKLESSCKKSDSIEFVDKKEALDRLTKDHRILSHPKWIVRVPFEKMDTQIGIVPDYFFGLRRIDESMNIETVYFFLEADRGTMPVMRKSLVQTSIYRKLLSYHETWKKGLHTSLFGLKRLRILIIANSEERLNHIIAASKRLDNGKGSRIFLFASMPNVRSCEDILSMPLANGRDERKTTLLE